jgi:hypothetical protein
MNVQELLKSCDRMLLIDHIITQKHYAVEKRAEIEMVYFDLFDRLLALTPQRDETHLMIFGAKYVDDGNIAYTIEVLKDEDVQSSRKNKEASKEISKVRNDNLGQLTTDELRAVVDGLSDKNVFMQGYGIELSDWDNILGFDVSDYSVATVGKEFLMALILAEMTFFGFDEVQKNKERDNLLEIERERAADPEAFDAKCVSAEDLFRKFDMETTQEEKAEMDKTIYIECIENAIFLWDATRY